MQSIEDRLLKRLMASFNNPVIPSIKECTLEVYKGYDVVVQMIDLLEKQLHRVEDILIPDNQEIPHPSPAPEPVQPHSLTQVTQPPSQCTQIPFPQPTQIPSPQPTKLLSPPTSPIYITSSSPLSSSCKQSSPLPFPFHPETSPIQTYQATPQPPSDLSFTPRPEPSQTYARNGKAKLLPSTNFPPFNPFDDAKKGESSATQGQAVEAASILASILSKA